MLIVMRYDLDKCYGGKSYTLIQTAIYSRTKINNRFLECMWGILTIGIDLGLDLIHEIWHMKWMRSIADKN